MMISYNDVVWISEKGNIAITVCENMPIPSFGKRYRVYIKVFLGSEWLWRHIETFEKQSYAINFSCKIKDAPLKGCL